MAFRWEEDEGEVENREMEARGLQGCPYRRRGETEEAGIEAAMVRQGMARASAGGGQSSDGALCFGRRLRCAQGRAEETGARRQGLGSSFYTVRRGRGRGTVGR
jgi:hypothetical protein